MVDLPENYDQLTVEYYNQNAASFIAGTVSADMQSLYEPFVSLINPGARILDAGCGSGRDSLYFMKQGFEVTSIDASAEMVKQTTELTGNPALLMNFREIEFWEEAFDAVWASASLLHISKSEIDNIFQRIIDALVPGGIFYLSFKYGEGERIVHDRLFSFYNEESCEKLLGQHQELRLVKLWKTADVRKGREDEYWLNVMLKKNR